MRLLVSHCAGRAGWLSSIVAVSVITAAVAPAAAAREVAVVGLPHLQQLEPAPTPAQHAAVLAQLVRFAPTLVCVEAMPGERVREFAAAAQEHGELLSTFALDAIRLAPEQQARWSVDARSATRASRTLEQSAGTLTSDDRVRLIGLQLAAHEPWSAVLNWTSLDDAGRELAMQRLGRPATERLRALAASPNEIAVLAVPIASRLGHRRLCAVDSFVDEAAVGALAEPLTPLLQDPSIGRGIAAFTARQATHWRAGDADGLAQLLRWTNSADFAELDRATQWDIFDREGAEDAGRRRLALWHARNAEIATHLYRGLASPDGERTLLLVGAAHRPFLEQALQAQPWVRTASALELLAARQARSL